MIVAPASIKESDYVALYFTKAFGDQRWAIHWYAPVRGHEMKRRRELVPEEADHPRADHACYGMQYVMQYVMQLGPLERLDPPIISLRWRRITFIETTWDRFQIAQEINELYASGADGLFVTLKDMGLAPEREYPVQESGCEYVVDLAIPCEDGTLAIVVDDRSGPSGALHLSSREIAAGGLDTVDQAVDGLGGVRLPE